MKKHRWVFVFLVAFFVSISFFVMAREPNKEAVISAVLLRHLSAAHFSPLPLDDAASERIFDLYLKRVDPGKQFFLASDIAILKQYEPLIDDELAYGKSTLLTVASRILQQRIEEVRGFYKQSIQAPYLFRDNILLEMDTKKKTYAPTKDVWRNQWENYLRQQVLTSYVIALDALPPTASARALAEKGELDLAMIREAKIKVEKTFGGMLDRRLKETGEEQFAQFLDVVANAFDPHTAYLAPQAKEDFDIGITGTLEGIGALLKEEDGVIKVTRVVPGSAAAKQKQLQAEDTILKVGQGDQESVDIVGYRVQDAVRLIRGKKGTTVRLTVRRPEGQILVIPIVRDVVVIEESYAKSALIKTANNDIFGYIHLPSFYRDFSNARARNATDDLRAELASLRAQRVAGVILDLRNNGGGALEDAVNVSGLFIDYGPIVQVKDRVGKNFVKYDPDPTIQYQGPLVIMVNAYSASASEILAAALQDYGRAVIVGSGLYTYGKGTVQTVLNLNAALIGGPEFNALRAEMGSVKVTNQKYYRITGGATQFRGVVPDIVLPDLYTYLEVGEQYLPYALAWSITSGLQYSRWPHPLPLDTLRSRSELRVSRDPVFETIRDQAAYRRAQRDAQWPLQLTKAYALQQKHKQDAAAFENLVKETTVYKAMPSDAGRLKEPERAKEYSEWLVQLQKDPALVETVHILQDLVGFK